MWTEFRYRILRMLRQIANVPECSIVPKWIQCIYYMLFPFNWIYQRNSGIHYDAPRDIYTIQGMKFSGEVFRHFKQSVGQRFEIESNDEGVIILRTLTAYDFFPMDKVCKN